MNQRMKRIIHREHSDTNAYKFINITRQQQPLHLTTAVCYDSIDMNQSLLIDENVLHIGTLELPFKIVPILHQQDF